MIVGSGPGGSVTASVLAAAGVDVVVLEEGMDIDSTEVRPFSREQMSAQYRSRGMTAAVGRPPISYTEGCCVGGGSQVNSGIYHPAPEGLIDKWGRELGIAHMSDEAFAPLAARVEDRLDVRADPAVGPSGAVLAAGASELGWRVSEPRRWVNRAPNGSTDRRGMRETFLRDAIDTGARLFSQCKVLRLLDYGSKSLVVEAVHHGRLFTVEASRVVLAAGAIQSPFLLARSGLSFKGVRGRLRMHPTMKAVAVFDEVVTRPDEVAATQVREFAPGITIGHAASRPGLVALGLAPHRGAASQMIGRWNTASVYYAATCGDGAGSIRSLPRANDPVVSYRLHRQEARQLASGLGRLLHLLLAAGARRVYPSFYGAPVVRTEGDVARALSALDIRSAPLMTVHLVGSLPLGSQRSAPAVDSWGRLLAEPRISINDASLLPSAPGVNPMGIVSAMALRNAEHLAAEIKRDWT